MIKRAVISWLIQWSSHSWYDISFLCNYAAPTAPHVFIASSTHVKLKCSLCTWYSIIACCTTMHNGKMSKPVIHSTSSSNRYAAITEHSCIYTDIQKGGLMLNIDRNIFQLAQSTFYTSVYGKWQYCLPVMVYNLKDHYIVKIHNFLFRFFQVNVFISHKAPWLYHSERSLISSRFKGTRIWFYPYEVKQMFGLLLMDYPTCWSYWYIYV